MSSHVANFFEICSFLVKILLRVHFLMIHYMTIIDSYITCSARNEIINKLILYWQVSRCIKTKVQ